MRVVFFPTVDEANALERRCYAYSQTLGQVSDRWAEIIVDALGYGVPVTDRIMPALTTSESAAAVEWNAPEPSTFA